VSFNLLSGSLASPNITGNLSSGGAGTSVASSISSNVTDSYASIIGIDNLTNINSYSLIRNDGEYDNITANIRAANLLVLPAVPLPAAIWLFGTAFIGLVGFSRRSKST